MSTAVVTRLSSAHGVLSVVLAGDRRVWRWAAVAGVPLVVLIVAWCLVPRAYYAGTDSVNALSISAPIAAGEPACAGGLNLPSGTSRIQVVATSGTRALPALRMTLLAAGRSYQSVTAPVAAEPAVVTRVSFPIPRSALAGSSVRVSICLRAADTVAWGITPTTEGIQSPFTVNGAPTLARLAVWYLPPPGARRSYLSEATAMFSRAAVFAPGFARPWLFAFVLLALLPAVAFLAVRLLAVAVAGGGRRLGLQLYVLVALNAIAWSLITPAFQAPDEVDHFAYVQSLVERGQKPTPYPGSARARWSTLEDDALRGSGMITDHQSNDSRAPWLAADVAAYHELIRTTGSNAANGGGYTGASGYGPLYYLALVPGYVLAPRTSTFTQLGLTRVISALIGALASVFTYLLIRELAPRRPWLGVLGGLLVGFQPMYAFLSGTVNNDIGVDAGAAAALYLLVRMVRRGIVWRTTLPLGLCMGLLPFVKGSGFDIYPLAIVAVVGALWRHRETVRASIRSTAVGIIALGLPAVVAYGGAALASSALTPPVPSRGAVAVVATAGASLKPVLHAPLSYATYLWEMFLPRLPGMHPHFPPGEYPASTIFVRRGWAAFGWYDTFFPAWVYRVVEAMMLLTAAAGLGALWKYRKSVRARLAETALIVLCPIVVIAGFAAVFYTPGQRALIAEHGRYTFPALAALAAWVVGALHVIDRERMVAVGTVLLVAVLGLGYASQLLTFTAFYA